MISLKTKGFGVCNVFHPGVFVFCFVSIWLQNWHHQIEVGFFLKFFCTGSLTQTHSFSHLNSLTCLFIGNNLICSENKCLTNTSLICWCSYFFLNLKKNILGNWGFFIPGLITWSSTVDPDITLSEMSFRSTDVSCPVCVSSQPLVHPQPTRWSSVRNRGSLGCVSTAQQ